MPPLLAQQLVGRAGAHQNEIVERCAVEIVQGGLVVYQVIRRPAIRAQCRRNGLSSLALCRRRSFADDDHEIGGERSQGRWQMRRSLSLRTWGEA